MVIKIASIDNVPCVKVSDDLTKVSGCISELPMLIVVSDHWGSCNHSKSQRNIWFTNLSYEICA